MKKEEARELLEWMIEKEKYNLTLEENYDSYGWMPCPQEIWDKTIDFIIQLVSNYEKENILNDILDISITYEYEKTIGIWWSGKNYNFWLWIDFEDQTFWYYGERKFDIGWIKKVKSTDCDFSINDETIKNLSVTLLEIIKE